MEAYRTLSFFSYALLLSIYGISVAAQNPPIGAIYQFGDSIADTGNLVKEGGTLCNQPPYGEAFFQHPTGRCSDGLLMIDYFAQAFKLPLISPYLDKSGDLSHGVNFAVSGATALDISVLATKNITATVTQSSLNVQLGWFKTHLATICSNPAECKQKLENALVLMGEIGGNDYNFAAAKGKTKQDLEYLVHDVVQTISNAVKAVIDLGATRIVVPGNFPVGCMTIYLVGYKSSDPTMYDELGCLKIWNDFASYHNNELQRAISSLQQEHPNVKIVYGDYFSAMKSLLQQGASLGFDKDGMHKACCGTGDPKYNFDWSHMCGSGGVTSCPDPSVRVSWDGIHLTQHAYQFMADQLLKQIMPSLV